MSGVQLVSASPARDSHRDGCLFGPGYYRVELQDGGRRYCQSEAEVEFVHSLLPPGAVRRTSRDGYCLDEQQGGTPDVVDGEAFLSMSRADGMRALGIESESEYTRAYRAVEDAVLARDRAAHTGPRPSIVIKRKGRAIRDVTHLEVLGAD